jgi:hypothetical protein
MSPRSNSTYNIGVGTGIQPVPRKTSTKKVEDLSGGGLISTNNL